MLVLQLQHLSQLMQRDDLLKKTLMLRKSEDGRRRRQQDEMAGQQHQHKGHEFEQAHSGDSDGQGSLACCGPRGHKELGMMQRLNSNKSIQLGVPGGASGKEPPCQSRRRKRHRFNPWVRKMPGGGHGNHSSILAWRTPRKEEPGGQSPWGHKVSDTTEVRAHSTQLTHFTAQQKRA